MARYVPPPSDEQVQQTVRDLKRIGARKDLSGLAAWQALSAAGIPTGRQRAGRAAAIRREGKPAQRNPPAIVENRSLAARPDVLAEAAALNTTALDTASCKGRQPMFDAEIHGETPSAATTRLAAAVELCGTCPVHTACDTARQALPARQVTGVWAGRVYGRPTRKAA